jgi:hypothetical protein
VAQGRIEEAERLVAGLEDQIPAAPAVAAIHLGRGKPGLAATVVRRSLETVTANEIERALLGELLGEAEIAEGGYQEAGHRGRDLAELGGALDCRVIVARGERLQGHALAAGGDGSTAEAHLAAALSEFSRLGMPFETAVTHLMLAESSRALDPKIAVAEARVALAVFEDLGASRQADAAAALLRDLGVKAARVGPKGLGTLTKRDRKCWPFSGRGSPTPRSRSASTSAARPWSTTWPRSSPSSGQGIGPRPRPWRFADSRRDLPRNR